MDFYQIWYRSLGGPLADVINCAEFFVDRFRSIDFVGVEIYLVLLNVAVITL